MKFFYVWHRRLGWVLAPLLALSALSGAVLLWFQPLPAPVDTVPPTAQWANALDMGVAELERARAGARVDMVDFPRQAGHPIRVRLAGAQWVEIDARSGAVAAAVSDQSAWRTVLLKLHEHLLLADVGNWFLRASSLGALVLIVMGLRVWWRVRAAVTPSPWRRWHRRIGVLAALPLAMILVTGFVLLSPELTRASLSLLGGPPPPPPRAEVASGTPRATLGHALRMASAAMPGAQPTRLYATSADVLRMRMRSDEWHPNGLNDVYLRSDNAAVQRTTTWRELPLAARYPNIIYPLHIGWLPGSASVVGAIVMRTLWTAIALSLAWLALSGSVQHWRGRPMAPRRSAKSPQG